jgi:hypothetical protein
MRIQSGITDQYHCKECGQDKPVESFGVDRHIARGRKYTCKLCFNAKRKGEVDPLARGRYLKRKYGITLDKYQELIVKQGGVCAICQQPGEPRSGGNRAKDCTPLYIDHCHIEGSVRGLLCHRCNVAIGLLQDDPCRADRASEYIRGMPVQFIGKLKCA